MKDNSSNPIKKIEESLDEICQALFAARRYQAMWWILCGEARLKNVDMMNHYLDCSRGLIGATFDAGIVALYKVIDKRNGTNNIYKLFERLESSDKFLATDIATYKRQLAAHNSTIKGVKIIRGDAVGHINDNRAYLEVFKQADIKVEQWKALVDALIEIVCDAYYKQSRVIHGGWFNTKAAKELDAIFDDLKAFHAAKTKRRF